MHVVATHGGRTAAPTARAAPVRRLTPPRAVRAYGAGSRGRLTIAADPVRRSVSWACRFLERRVAGRVGRPSARQALAGRRRPGVIGRSPGPRSRRRACPARSGRPARGPPWRAAVARCEARRTGPARPEPPRPAASGPPGDAARPRRPTPTTSDPADGDRPARSAPAGAGRSGRAATASGGRTGRPATTVRLGVGRTSRTTAAAAATSRPTSAPDRLTAGSLTEALPRLRQIDLGDVDPGQRADDLVALDLGQVELRQADLLDGELRHRGCLRRAACVPPRIPLDPATDPSGGPCGSSSPRLTDAWPRGPRARSRLPYHRPVTASHPARPGDRPALPRAPPPAPPAARAAAGAGVGAARRRPPRVAPVRPARRHRPQPRPRPRGPDRRLPASLDGRAAVRGAAAVRGLQQGPLAAADRRAAVVPGRLGSEPRRTTRPAAFRDHAPARRGAARPDPARTARSSADRRRTAGRDRLVLAADQPGPGDPRGARRGRHPRARPARRQPAGLRPGRAALPGRPARRAPARARAAPAQAAVALPGARPARALGRAPSCGSGTAPAGADRRDRRGRADPGRAPGRAGRGRGARAGRRRGRPRRAVRPRRGGRPARGDRRRATAADPASRSSRRSIRSSGTASSCGRCTTSTTSGRSTSRREAPLGLLRPADPVRRPAGRADRAAHRSPATACCGSLDAWWEDGFDPVAEPTGSPTRSSTRSRRTPGSSARPRIDLPRSRPALGALATAVRERLGVAAAGSGPDGDRASRRSGCRPCRATGSRNS